jgi:hypothetical protein
MTVKIIALGIQLNAILILSTSAQIIVDGKSEYTIYSSPAATETERYAAQELQQYLYEISGAQLPITQEPHQKTIYVGFQGAPKALLNGLKPNEFEKEEYISPVNKTEHCLSQVMNHGTPYTAPLDSYKITSVAVGIQKTSSQLLTKQPYPSKVLTIDKLLHLNTVNRGTEKRMIPNLLYITD